MSDSSDPETGTSNSGCNTPPRKKSKRWYQQSFNKQWLTDVELRDWVKEDPNDKNTAICSVCDWKLKNCDKSALMKHKASSKHTRNLDTKKNTLNIKQFFKRSDAELPQDKVAKAEMYLTGYMAEHGVPFAQADHLVDVIKKMFPECETARNMKIKKTKASYMLQDGIAWEERQLVAKFCRENYFSLIIDESTDVSVSQVLAVMVRVYDEKKCKVADLLLDFVEVDDASAEGLYKSVKEMLEKEEIPLQNIVGLFKM
ncbi:zinc finger BED domain-containing protein 5-like [Palaemon carinicauda]|uniref:zinc finger BED domain-containing protein 5-like n=1 Tax=Palaemon carinicauda TaxID=392227 RepID=UPI0035B664BA